MTNMSGCAHHEEKKLNQKKAEVEQSFNKVLSIYPTKDLTKFYDMEGYRDEDFAKNDKGVWLLDSSMSISIKEDDPLITEGMLLRMNRNTRKAKGYYYISSIPEDTTKETEETQYPVTYDETGFHLVEPVSDPELKAKIESFQFFVQYASFKKLDQYKNLRKMYNPEVPMYELEYQLTNDDSNVKELRKRYDIPVAKAPKLMLKGRGNLKGGAVGYKEIEIRFSTKIPVVFDDTIDFQPLSEEDKE